jgi:hypothetical protein
MDSQLSGERLTEERAFVKRFSEGLSSHKVEYPADFSTPLEERPRKVPVVQVCAASRSMSRILSGSFADTGRYPLRNRQT